jgi:ribosomal protein S18 acetylase RimI-like enzyme
LNTDITELDPHAIEGQISALAQIMADSVNMGGSIGYMAPMSGTEAARFWYNIVMPEAAQGKRIVFAAQRGGAVVGTVQLITATPPNQPHRAEIAKMMVAPNARRLGVGRALMVQAITRAKGLGKTLLTLDTRTGDVAAPLYASVGFQVAGVIPDYAFDADGKGMHATTYMYCRI